MRALFILVAWLAFAPKASACDVCGCSIGGNYFGILPQFHKHFVGLRWSDQSSRSTHSLISAKKGIFDTEAQIRSVDIISRFYPWRRVQMLTLVPYHDFHRKEIGNETHNQGVGDCSILANFILLDSGDSLHQRWKHSVTVGGGVKLPTGRAGARDSEGKALHENLQTGSGSTDFMISATYTLRRGSWGLSSDVLGRLNTTNKNGYHFGNRVSGSTKVFYLKKIQEITLLPNAGVFSDCSDVSRDHQLYAQGTGGTIALATFGLDIYFGRFSAGYTHQIPVYQDLGGGKVQSKQRWLATLNYNF
jgi:hypothetical protein